MKQYTITYHWRSGLRVEKSLNFSSYRKAAGFAARELKAYPMLDRITFVSEETGQKYGVDRQ